MTARTDAVVSSSLATNATRAITAAKIRDLWDTTVAKENRFSVKQFGALGNGVADDSTAIQNCINEASLAASSSWGRGGGYVLMPAGTYMTSQKLLIADSVTVVGEYGGTMVKMMPGANLTGIFHTDAVNALCGLRDIVIHGNRTAQSGKLSRGLALEHSSTNAGFGGSSIIAGELQDPEHVFENILVVAVDGIGIRATGAASTYRNVHVVGTNGRGIETLQNDSVWLDCSVHNTMEEGWACSAGSGRYLGCRASFCGSLGFANGAGFRVLNGNQTFYACSTADTDGAGFLVQSPNVQVNGFTIAQACNLRATVPSRSGGWTGQKCALEVRGSGTGALLLTGLVRDKFVGTANAPNLTSAVRNALDGNLISVGGDPRVLVTPGTTPWVTGGTNTTIVHNHNG